MISARIPDLARPNLPSRDPSLDVLRAIAIILVLGRHVLWIPSSGEGLIGTFFSVWRRCGWVGVDLFFILSGFLVGGLLIQEALQHGSIRPLRFLIRRGLKIYPSFYAFLILSLLLARAAHFLFLTWPKGLYSEIFFLQSYIPGLWPQTWSLAVEEHFYLLLLTFFCVGSRRLSSRDRLRWLPIAVLATNTLILMGRVGFGYARHAIWSDLFIQTHWRLDSLLFGVGLAYFYHCKADRLAEAHRALAPWQWLFLPLFILPSLILPLEESRYVTTFGSTGLYLGFGWIVIEAMLCRTQAVLAGLAQYLAPIGRHSYSIYLWHVPVYYFLVPAIKHWAPSTSFGAVTAAYLVATLGVGTGLSLLIEQPVLRWRNRIIPSGSR